MTENRSLKQRARAHTKITGDKYTTSLEKIKSRSEGFTLKNSFSDVDYRLYKKLFSTYSTGMVRPRLLPIIGEMGSGKTTVLAATLNEIDTTHNHMITVEDNEELEHLLHSSDKIMKVVPKDRSITETLKLVHRTDMDVVVLGEVRNAESYQMLQKMSQTGVAIFTTINLLNFSYLSSLYYRDGGQIYFDDTIPGVVQTAKINIENNGSVYLNAVVPFNSEIHHAIKNNASHQEFEAIFAHQGIMTINAKIQNLIDAKILAMHSNGPNKFYYRLSD
jgi:ABC-type dipeptide/oligopeptide/nickel transport system ATPase component